MTWMRWTLGAVAGGTVMLARVVAAQELDSPPGAAVDPEPAPPAAASSAEPGSDPVDAAPVWGDDGSEPAPSSSEPGVDVAASDEDGDARARRESLAESPSLLGATGLMRVLSAASGAPGTFRLSLLTGFYSGSGFLCPQCPNAGQGGDLRDDVDRVTANLFLSATPTSFLEAYAGIFSHSTSTNRPVAQLKQVVGDWNLGVKAFMPAAPDQMLTFGGALDLGFSTGSGQVGISGIDSVNIGLHALASADLSKNSGGPLPLRAHLNIGYLFDNSAKLVADFEKSQERLIDRIERFSLDINRVDSLQIGLGVEGLFDTARPFLEWTIDVPTNRQGYLCLRSQALAGDSCLRDRPQFSTTPSRLSAGVRVMPWSALPWWLEGMSVTGALDVATGGASDFLVEVAPEVPWNIWFGIAYAADTHPRVKVQQVTLPAPEPLPEPVVHGMVVEKETAHAIADALIRFEGRDLTGLISTTEGHFVTSALEPGRYTFKITAAGYKDGSCSLDIGDVPLQAPGTPPLPSSSAPGTAHGLGASPAAVEAAPGVSNITCELEAAPRVSNLNGRVSDTTTGNPIGNASVHIADVLGRELELQVDEVGAFRFENVPPGSAVITVHADGYLKSVTRLEVEPLQELDQRFVLAPVPAKPSISVAGKHLELAAPIVFPEGSAKLSREGLFTVQELAPFLEQHPEIGRIEIQSHAADDGLSSATLTTDRANAIRDALVLHGVPSDRVTARGYGGSEPAAPGDSEQNRKRNERIVFVLDPTP